MISSNSTRGVDVCSPFVNNADLKKPEALCQFIIDAASKHGNRTALIDAATGWNCTYSQFIDYVMITRAYLRSLSIKAGERIALISFNCPEFVLTQIAAISIGAVVIMGSPLATVDELVHSLTISKCERILTKPELYDKMLLVYQQLPICKTVQLAYSQKALGAEETQLEPDLSPFDETQSLLVYFSSGTTGPSKAYEFKPNNFALNVKQSAVQPYNHIREADRQEKTLVALPMTQVYSTTTSYYAMFNGDVLVTLPRYRAEPFLKTIESYKINYLFLVPPLVNFLAYDPCVDSFDLSSLHSIVSAAALLAPNIGQACKERLKLKDLRQLYGMTEILNTTWTPYGHENFESIGLPLPGVRIRIVDVDTMEPVTSALEKGELWVTGPQVGGSYFGNESANRDTFVTVDNHVWCRTGDIGYYDSQGYLYLNDRIKDVIKYKGVQISPSEIECRLLTHPGVRDCAVIGRPDPVAGEIPTAFVVKMPEVAVDVDALHDLVKGHFSTVKQLSGGIIFLNVLPRSPTGKVLRRELRKLLTSSCAKL